MRDISKATSILATFFALDTCPVRPIVWPLSGHVGSSTRLEFDLQSVDVKPGEIRIATAVLHHSDVYCQPVSLILSKTSNLGGDCFFGVALEHSPLDEVHGWESSLWNAGRHVFQLALGGVAAVAREEPGYNQEGSPHSPPSPTSLAKTVESIVVAFETHLKYTSEDDQWMANDDGFNISGRTTFASTVEFFVARKLPVQFVLPSFPCKSSNQVSKLSQRALSAVAQGHRYPSGQRGGAGSSDTQEVHGRSWESLSTGSGDGNCLRWTCFF
jgi:hypothetical protein